jgi:hypothetical protein
MKCLHVVSLILVTSVLFFAGCKKKTDNTPTINTITISSAINTNTTWSASNIYIIDGEVDVDNCTLTIEPGTTIKFNTGSSLWFGYYNNCTVIANGTADKRIKFTSSASTPAPGSWNGVHFSSHCLNNTSITYCDFEYGGTADNGIINIENSKIKFDYNSVKNSIAYGIDLSYEGSFVTFTNNSISNCESHAIVMKASFLNTLGENNTITCGSNLGIFVSGSSVTSAAPITWVKQTVPFYFTGETDFDNVTLTINPGCTFKFDANSSWWIGYYNNATLIANGTDLTTGKITFTTSASNPAPGAWQGLYFSGHTQSGTKLNFCEIAYGGYSGYDTDSNIDVNAISGTVTISNCAINYSQAWGISLNGTALSAQSTGNTFIGNTLGNTRP